MSIRVLLFGENNAPNVRVYPDANEIGIYDAPRRSDWRFGARFGVGDALSDYRGGQATIAPPAPPEWSRGIL